MCGIVGYIGNRNAGEILLESLKRLEYRGYDSSGVAVVENGHIKRERSVGKLAALEKILLKNPIRGGVGVGHTRWATHGKPSEENAHPHTDCKGEIVVVHNGIIENYPELKSQLLAEGHQFSSQTDTEVVAHLVEKFYRGDLAAAVRQALTLIRGAYALGVLCLKEPHRVIAARKDCPLILGLGEKENFLASDIPAILPYTRRVIYLEENQVAVLEAGKVEISDAKGVAHDAPVKRINWDPVAAEKAGFRHFMLKEIYEQPRSFQDTLRGRLDLSEGEVVIEELGLSASGISGIERIHIVACGTAYHAGLIGKFLFENIARIPTEVDIASEFRYRGALVSPKDLVLAISQSGETADTISAARLAKSQGSQMVAICNTMGSTLAREANGALYTRCGPEIGVASTKAFIGQLAALYLLALAAARARGILSSDAAKSLMVSLAHIPVLLSGMLEDTSLVESLAQHFYKKTDFLYLGRHINYPIALEAALKLKEISYIHAEGYPAGEMKHGPIALIDENLPVVAIATESSVYEKILSNIEEAKARGGIVIALSNPKDERVRKISDFVLEVPRTEEWLSPAVNILPLQLLAYHIAVLRGCDVDQPRNLAKSVTVE